jgi:hypothetical protein
MTTAAAAAAMTFPFAAAANLASGAIELELSCWKGVVFFFLPSFFILMITLLDRTFVCSISLPGLLDVCLCVCLSVCLSVCNG